MKALVVAVALCQVACATSQYQPPTSPTAKLLIDGSARTLVVGEHSAPVTPYSSEYVDLFEGKPREYASDSYTSSVVGTVLGLAGLAGVLASFAILPDAAQIVDLDSDRGKVAFGVLLGSSLVSVIGGMFNTKSSAQLNDAINLHNDGVLATMAHAAPAPVVHKPAPARVAPPPPAPTTHAPPAATAPATETAPAVAPAAPAPKDSTTTHAPPAPASSSASEPGSQEPGEQP